MNFWPLIKVLPVRTHFRFVRLSKIAALLSVVAVIASLALTLLPFKPPCGGLACGIDFEGGTVMEISTAPKAVDLAKTRAALSGMGIGDVQVVAFGAPSSAMVRFQTPAGKDASATVKNVQAELTQTLGTVRFASTELVGPRVSNELLTKGVLGLGLAILAMLLYIWFRFELQFGLGAVAALFQKDPAVLIAHAGQGNDSFPALKGKKIMISPDTRIGFWRYLKNRFGYTDDQIAPYTFNLAPFLADPKAIQQGYLGSEPFEIERAGQKPVVLLMADSGYASYASLIVTARKLTQDKPDLVRRFIAASIEGWRSYLDGDPAPAEKLIKGDNPDMSDALLAYGRKAMKDNAIVGTPVGGMEDARWKAFFDVMAADGLYPKTMDYKAAYTADFLPKAGK